MSFPQIKPDSTTKPSTDQITESANHDHLNEPVGHHFDETFTSDNIPYGWQSKFKIEMLSKLRNRVIQLVSETFREAKNAVFCLRELVSEAVLASVTKETRSIQAREDIESIAIKEMRSNTNISPIQKLLTHNPVSANDDDSGKSKNPKSIDLPNVICLPDQQILDIPIANDESLPILIEQKEQEPKSRIQEILLTDTHGDWDTTEKTLQKTGALDAQGEWTEEVVNGELEVHVRVTGDAVNRGDKSHPALEGLIQLKNSLPADTRSGIHYNLGNHCLQELAHKKSSLTEEQEHFLKSSNIIDFETIGDQVIGYFHSPNIPIWLLERAVELKSQGENWQSDLNHEIYHQHFEKESSMGKCLLSLNKRLFDDRTKPEKYWKKNGKRINELLAQLFGSKKIVLFGGHVPVKKGKHEQIENGAVEVIRGDLAIKKGKITTAAVVLEHGNKKDKDGSLDIETKMTYISEKISSNKKSKKGKAEKKKRNKDRLKNKQWETKRFKGKRKKGKK